MKISYNWLSSYFAEKLPEPEKLVELLTAHSFEIESVEPIGKDFIFDCKILPDRAHDLLSHVGMAREVHTITGVPIKQLLHPTKFPISSKLVTRTENTAECLRFSGLMVENIQVKETSSWMKTFLEAVGQRAINNIVDITNLTMFHLGQPLHAYDRDKLTERSGTWSLVCEKAGQEEEFQALDGKTYTITPEMLVIRDGHSGKTLGIAGIKGGKASEITTDTKHVIFEAANFNPTLIRKTSQKLRLRTDASERFEKEITPELTLAGLQEAAVLLKEEAFTPDTVIEGLSDAYQKKRNPFMIGVSLPEINRKLGFSLSPQEVESIFGRFGFVWKKVKPVDQVINEAPKFVGVPYQYGASISYDAPKTFDCSAFTAYLYSQAGVAIPRITVDQYLYGEEIGQGELQAGDLVFSQNAGVEDEKEFTLVTGQSAKQKVMHTHGIELMQHTDVFGGVEHVGIYLGDNKIIHAAGKWCSGIVTLENLDSSKAFQDIRGYRRFSDNEERYVVTVPSERLDLMAKRAFLVSGNKEDLIEEIGRVYGYEKIPSVSLAKTSFRPAVNKTLYYADKMRRELIREGYSEVMTYAFTSKGEIELENPLASDKKFLRSSILPSLEMAYEENKRNKDLLGLDRVKIFEIGKVFDKQGEWLRLAKMPDKTEINLEELIAAEPNPESYEFGAMKETKAYTPISLYPFISRDVAVFVPAVTDEAEIENRIRQNAGDLLVLLRCFDRFEKDAKVSYAFRLVFQSFGRTLTDEEINPIMDRVYLALQNEGFEIR